MLALVEGHTYTTPRSTTPNATLHLWPAIFAHSYFIFKHNYPCFINSSERACGIWSIVLCTEKGYMFIWNWKCVRIGRNMCCGYDDGLRWCRRLTEVSFYTTFMDRFVNHINILSVTRGVVDVRLVYISSLSIWVLATSKYWNQIILTRCIWAVSYDTDKSQRKSN